MDNDINFDINKMMKENQHISIQDLAKNVPKQNLIIDSGLNGVMRESEEMHKNMIRNAEESRKKKEQYEQDILNTLRQIEGNTANLTTIVNLIQSSNEEQGEILEIISDLLALAKEEEQEVVKSNYRRIMNKITTFTKDVETITTLAAFGTTIFNILKSGA